MPASDLPPRDRWAQRPWCWLAQFLGSVTFYTCIPLPHHWPLSFQGIARYAPGVGMLLGALLAAGDRLLALGHLPLATRSGLIIALWVVITGGLHLDGAMDTADGLATPDPARRLAVMTDSHTGAFGVMAAIGVLGLKFVALADLDTLRWFGLMAAAGWGRWGQVVAIARYPYLKATGKGALHKAHAHPRTDWLWGMALLVGLSGVALSQEPHSWGVILGAMGGGGAISLLSGAWLQRQLGGHTGDTYGAIVEWTEALFLCGLVGCAQFL